jgi:hypothetical protein
MVELVDDWDMVELVVDEQGTSVVGLVEVVGPVPVVGGVVDDDVVLPGKSVVVVAVVVVVPDGGIVEHPNTPASDPSTAPAPGRPAKVACSDRSSWQIGSRMDGSSCERTGSLTTCVDTAAGIPRTSAPLTKRHSPRRRRLATIDPPPLGSTVPSRHSWEREDTTP